MVLVAGVNVAAAVVLRIYTEINLWPDLAGFRGDEARSPGHALAITLLCSVVAPSLAGMALIWPVLRFRPGRGGSVGDVPVAIAQRAANLPLWLAAFSLLGWTLVSGYMVLRSLSRPADLPVALEVHVALRPMLAALVSASVTFFAAEYLCRRGIWPGMLAAIRISGNRSLHRVRISHRLLALWMAISLFPLGAVTLTTLAGVAGVDLAAQPVLDRVVSVVLLLAATAGVGGAALVWLVARSVGPPLEALEAAMARVRNGDLSARQPVGATDETGALAEGFNLMAGRLAESTAALVARNRELAGALDRVHFLEQVKRGLDRFVPDVVRHAVEDNPDAPSLEKASRDVTVMFVDIEAYGRLSENLSRPVLNDIVERYFSLYLTPIRAASGDINETAGDGLMVIFGAGGREEHAVAAVQAALAIRALTTDENLRVQGAHPAITVNIGISSGECDVGATRFKGAGGDRWTFTASGPATNLAARLGDLAQGGEILLADETARRVRGQFELRDLGRHTLKNIAVPVEAWAVLGQARAVAA